MKNEASVADSNAAAAAARKGRASKGVTEAYYFILALAWNDMVSSGVKMVIQEQEETMKVKSAEWADALFIEYPHVPLKSDVTPQILHEELNADSGNGMIRKAKEMIYYVTNVLNPVWKEPDIEMDEALYECRKVAWLRNEEERKRKRKLVAPYERGEKPFDAAWSCKEWLAFRYLGIPAGKDKCLQIFQSHAVVSGPSYVKKQHLRRVSAVNEDSMQQKGSEGVSDEVFIHENEDDIKSNNNIKTSDKDRANDVAIFKHNLWREEKERLETLIKLSEQLNMPSEVNNAHLLDLYNFLLNPIMAGDESDERNMKSQKKTPSVDPISAVAVSSKPSSSTLSPVASKSVDRV